MGCVLYVAYNRRRNIKDSMMVHMLNNSITTIPLFLPTYIFTLNNSKSSLLINKKVFYFNLKYHLIGSYY